MGSSFELRLIFEALRVFVDRSDNDFSWSSWEDEADALAEIDGILGARTQGHIPLQIGGLFAPTGRAQEVAVSSGWGDEFCDLADRFDAAYCSCLQSPSSELHLVGVLGCNDQGFDFSELKCLKCGQQWLRAHMEVEGISGSGRWYLGPTSPEEMGSANARNGRIRLAHLHEYFYGGSYFDARVGVANGPLA